MPEFYSFLYELANERCSTAKGLTETLDLMAKHPQLTPENILLLGKQMPNATAVGGYYAWAAHYHRPVKAGEEPIILARPALKKDEKVPGQGLDYEFAPVYDISQTENNPDAVGLEEFPRLSAQDVVAAFRELTSCLVEEVPSTGSLVSYDAGRNVLQVATDDKKLMAQEMLRAYSEYATRARGLYEDKLFSGLIGECAAYLAMRYHGIGNPKTPVLYATWNEGGSREGNEFLHLLNQIYWTSQTVNREFCKALHKPLMFNFHEVGIINQVFTCGDKLALIERLGEIRELTPHPSLIEATVCLKDSLERILTDNDVRQIYRDRAEKRVLTQPIYRILSDRPIKR